MAETLHWCSQLPNGHADSAPHQTVTRNFTKKGKNRDVITRVVKTTEPFDNLTFSRLGATLYHLPPLPNLPVIVASGLMNQ